MKPKTIDLQPFCYKEEDRDYLMKPFTRGEFTYATNGHIAVRVPRLQGVPEGKCAAEKVFPETPPALTSIIFAKLPPLPVGRDCGLCEGRGSEHDCPDCKCECSLCDGSGEIVPKIAVKLRGAAFDLKYVRQIAALPSLLLPEKTTGVAGMYFRFFGGEGVLMPMRSDDSEILEAEEASHA